MLFSGRSLENTLFELGIAIGLARPTIIFAEPGIKLPQLFMGINIQYSELANLPTLIPAIEEFLTPNTTDALSAQTAPAESRQRFLPKARERMVSAISALRQDLNSSTPITESQIEARLVELFDSVGWTVAKGAPRARRHSHFPDLALWIDEVQKEIGNPIAIEIKPRLQDREIENAISSLTSSLTTIGASAGILLHHRHDLRFPQHVYQSTPLVFIFGLDELAELLENDSFPAVLKKSRRVVRGGT